MTDCVFVLTVQNGEGFAFCGVYLYIVTGVCQRFVLCLLHSSAVVT